MMRGYRKMTAAIFAGAFALSACAQAANDSDDRQTSNELRGKESRQVNIHTSDRDVISSKLRSEILREVELELADALDDIDAAADDLAEAKRDMIEAEAELAELNLSLQMKEEMALEFKQALDEIEQAKEELVRAKAEMEIASEEMKSAIVEEMAEFELEIQMELEIDHDHPHAPKTPADTAQDEPMHIVPQSDDIVE